MTAKIQMRRDTKANWDANSGVTLFAGEIGVELDGTVPQAIKIGSGLTWANTPYFAGLPARTATADYNTMNTVGLYKINGDPTTPTNGPSGDLALASADGDASLVVLQVGSEVVQMLFTTGDGSLAQKAYWRIYDGDSTAWRAWTPMTLWATGASAGTPVACTTLNAKGAATLEGALTVSGATTMNGTVTIGDADADVVALRAGTAGAPILTKQGDLDTGLYFPADNEVALTTGGTARVTVVNATTTVANDLAVTGTSTFTGNVTIPATSWPQVKMKQLTTNQTHSLLATRPTTSTPGTAFPSSSPTSLVASITPRSASSKILVTFNLSIFTGNTSGSFVLMRNVGGTLTEIGSSTEASPLNRTYGIATIDGYSTRSDTLTTQVIQYLDSPATTSSVSYELYLYGTPDGGSFTMNVNHCSSNNNDVTREYVTSSVILQEYFA